MHNLSIEIFIMGKSKSISPQKRARASPLGPPREEPSASEVSLKDLCEKKRKELSDRIECLVDTITQNKLTLVPSTLPETEIPFVKRLAQLKKHNPLKKDLCEALVLWALLCDETGIMHSKVDESRIFLKESELRKAAKQIGVAIRIKGNGNARTPYITVDLHSELSLE